MHEAPSNYAVIPWKDPNKIPPETGKIYLCLFRKAQSAIVLAFGFFCEKTGSKIEGKDDNYMRIMPLSKRDMIRGVVISGPDTYYYQNLSFSEARAGLLRYFDPGFIRIPEEFTRSVCQCKCQGHVQRRIDQ